MNGILRFCAVVFSCELGAAMAAENRAMDGKGNNVENHQWGASGTQLQRFARVFYGDGMSTMGGEDRPNPRTVSQIVASQAFLTQSARGLSDMTWCWGQFLDHDISLVLPNPEEFIPVMIPMMRSHADPATGTGKENPRQQMNTTTAFIDASMVYGHTEARAAALRTFVGGGLIMREGGLLPWNTAGIGMENPNHLPEDEL